MTSGGGHARIWTSLLVALLAMAPIQVFAGPEEEEEDALFARWKAAYDANDNVAVAKLYATDASYMAPGAEI